jgi:hypothetical protein
MLQPVLSSVVSEPNTPVTRQGLVSRIDSIVGTLKAQGVIFNYTVSDATTTADIAAATCRIDLKVWFHREIDFVELKLTAAIGG